MANLPPLVNDIAVYLFICLALTYLLWVLFLAMMNLKRVNNAGLLTKPVVILGIPLLIVGHIVDAVINWTAMTLILFELPQELTVTARLRRHNKKSSGWRKKVAQWFEPLLDPFDPSGDHI